jgi:hypothetical protein
MEVTGLAPAIDFRHRPSFRIEWGIWDDGSSCVGVQDAGISREWLSFPEAQEIVATH